MADDRMETAAEVYLHWILTYLYEADVEMITDHAVKNINGAARSKLPTSISRRGLARSPPTPS